MRAEPELLTPRLRLRRFVTQDAEDLFGVLGGKDVLKYFPPMPSPSLTLAERMIERIGEQWEADGYGLWAVESRDTARLLGRCGFQYLPETKEVEIDYILGPEHWGRGIASEAASTALQHGLDDLGFTRVIGIVHPENLASRAVLKKIGMTFDVQTEYFGMLMDRYLVER